MSSGCVTGIFDSVDTARNARNELLQSGVEETRMALSVPLHADELATEAPGQSYENQPGQPERENAESRYQETLRSAGDCSLTVDCDSSSESERLKALLKDLGARRIAVPPRGPRSA